MSDKPQKIAEKLKALQKEQANTYRTYVKTSAVGLEVGLSIGLSALAGYYFDKHFHSSPWGLLVGALIGTVAAAKRLWVFVKAYVAKQDSHDDE